MKAQLHTREIDPAEGRWKSRLLNLLLRLLVKSGHGRRIDIRKLRKQFERLDGQAPKTFPTDVHRSDVNCNGVAAQWLTPAHCRPERVLLYIHGGAFVAYTPEVYAAMVASWCRPLKTRALMLDYRLAPEHPFPTALHEALDAYRWLLDRASRPATSSSPATPPAATWRLRCCNGYVTKTRPCRAAPCCSRHFSTSPSAARVPWTMRAMTRSSPRPSPSAFAVSMPRRIPRAAGGIAAVRPLRWPAAAAVPGRQHRDAAG